MSERHSELRVLRWTDRIQGILDGKQYGPIRANLDLTNLCSHACPWCEPVDFRKATIADKNHTLSAEVAAAVMDDLDAMDCRAIQFSGGGEPTLHPEFGALLILAKLHQFRTLVVTHGGFIDKWIGQLGDCADHVRVSLDASSESEHQQMHGSKEGEFDHIRQNIQALVDYRGLQKWPEIGITYNVADCNSNNISLRRIRQVAEELRVDYVQFRPLSEDRPKRFTSHWPFLVKRIEKEWEVSTVRIETLGQRRHDVFYQREFSKCFASLTLSVISANGDVSACCDRRDITFGNVNEKPFREIWLSAIHREKAASIVPKLCNRCVLCGYNRSVEKYVVRNEAIPELI